ncbi:MAG: hypothetical protein J6S21_04020 [Victivallales bacterium]|nr:hypothetical protein [Victivallales bacterium]
MKYTRILSCSLALFFALLSTSYTLNAADYFVTNRKRVEDITKTILSEIEKQQKEFEKKLTEQNSASNPADPYGMPPGMGPGMGPGMAPGMGPGMAPGMGPDAAKPDAPKVERFSLDKEAIKKALRAKYRYDFDGSVNASASGTVDTRSELEIREDIINELVNSGEIRPESELLQEDQAKCDADYPLYKPGEMVDIAIDLGNTVRRFNGAFKRISPSPVWSAGGWLTDAKLSGGAIVDMHIHDIDYMLQVFGVPKKTSSVKNTLGEKNSYIATVCDYGDFAVSVEGTWFLPPSYPFNIYYRVAFERGAAEYDRGVLTLYTEDGAHRPDLAKSGATLGGTGGNIAEVSGYVNELRYFTDRIRLGAPIEEATLESASRSLSFVLDELKACEE